jgi:hypothetical protein
MAAITERETRQIEEANASGRTPVVFIHIDSGWREVAETALAFVKRFV